MFNELRKKLKYLKKNHNLIGIKGGTEVEAMNFLELDTMRRLSEGIVPMTVKIGGSEARNDISFMIMLGVDVILCPMIESEYGLKNFVETMKDMDKDKKIKLAINIETKTSCNSIKDIIECCYFNAIDSATIGRSDLASSLYCNTEHELIYRISVNIVNIMRTLDKKVSVGGKITINNVKKIRDKINPDHINTRNMIFSCTDSVEQDVKKILEWEIMFYEYLKDQMPERLEFYNIRINDIKNRLVLS